jgi:hypothetical protein
MTRRASNPWRSAAVMLVALLAGGLLVAAGPLIAWAAKGDAEKAEAKLPQGNPGFYATTVGRSDRDMVVVQYWSKGALFRSETIISGHPIITVVNGDEYFTWDGLTKTGYVVRRTPAAVELDHKRKRPFGLELEYLVADGGEKIRSESLSGVPADVYRVTDDEGRRTIWVTSDKLALPLRMETYERRSGRTGQLDWVSWLPGLVIPDRFFVPPPDLSLTRFAGYTDYLAAMAAGPVLPTPPLYHYLLHQRSDE